MSTQTYGTWTRRRPVLVRLLTLIAYDSSAVLREDVKMRQLWHTEASFLKLFAIFEALSVEAIGNTCNEQHLLSFCLFSMQMKFAMIYYLN